MIPVVSVVMPVYNGEKYLSQAIESILSQTFNDFEFIIIDDGSVDSSTSILSEYANRDKRIRIHTQSQNRGLVSALNLGLELARGIFIARMDQDDISLPQRLDKQVLFLQSSPGIGLVGSQIRFLESNGNQIPAVTTYPLDDLSIRWALLFDTPFAHPATMYKRVLIEEHNLRYSPEYEKVEDYYLWSEMLKYTKAANLEEVLLLYRIHPESISQTNREAQRNMAFRIAYHNLTENLPGLHITFEEMQQLLPSMHRQSISQARMKKRAWCAEYYLKIWKAFSKKYEHRREINHISRQVLSIAAKLAFYPFFQPRALMVGYQLTKLDPFWGIYFICDIPYYLTAKIVGPITYRKLMSKKEA
jgi:glycosyltransferase involved in cell wall biosynthesis